VAALEGVRDLSEIVKKMGYKDLSFWSACCIVHGKIQVGEVELCGPQMNFCSCVEHSF